MSALLEVSSVRERVHQLSVEDYHRLGEMGIISEKVELLRGIVVDKMSKSPLHEYVAQQLLDFFLARVPDGFKVRPERPLTLRDSEPEPDISIVRGRSEDWLREHPSTAHLVVEVSISSVDLDEEKGMIYAEAGILEYWMVRAGERLVDVFREPTPAGYGARITMREGDMLRCEAIPEIEVPLAEIFPSRERGL